MNPTVTTNVEMLISALRTLSFQIADDAVADTERRSDRSDAALAIKLQTTADKEGSP